MCWHTPVTTTLGRLLWEDPMFNVSLGYITGSCYKPKQNYPELWMNLSGRALSCPRKTLGSIPRITKKSEQINRTNRAPTQQRQKALSIQELKTFFWISSRGWIPASWVGPIIGWLQQTALVSCRLWNEPSFSSKGWNEALWCLRITSFKACFGKPWVWVKMEKKQVLGQAWALLTIQPWYLSFAPYP